MVMNCSGLTASIVSFELCPVWLQREHVCEASGHGIVVLCCTERADDTWSAGCRISCRVGDGCVNCLLRQVHARQQLLDEYECIREQLPAFAAEVDSTISQMVCSSFISSGTVCRYS